MELSDKAIAVLINSGYTLKDIAAMHSVHEGTVSRKAKRAGITPHRSKLTQERRQAVSEVMRESGIGIAIDRLSTMTDIPRATAHRHRVAVQREFIRSVPPPTARMLDAQRLNEID